MKKFISKINECMIYKISENPDMFRVFHPDSVHKYENFDNFNDAKAYAERMLPELPPYFETFIKDITTRNNVEVFVQKRSDCIWITLGNERDPRILIDSVDNKVRVCIYKENAQDSEEPEIYPTGYETR